MNLCIYYVLNIQECKAGKVIIDIAKEDVQQAAGSLLVCASQDAGAEAAIHAMYDLLQQDENYALA